jgi:hypothetical protein
MPDMFLKLSHTMRNDVPVHNVKDIVDIFSKSDAQCALVEWKSGVSLLKAQQIVSKGINYYGYGGYIGTKTEVGHLFLYKKLAYDPQLLTVACHGKLASHVMKCLRLPEQNKKELEDIAMFCRWSSKVRMKETLAGAVLQGTGTVSLSVKSAYSNGVSKIRKYVKLMGYDCYINSAGEYLIITL